MKTITKGTIFLSDDFVQAQSELVQISDYALINLPPWHETNGIFTTATDIGLPADIVDPNVLLPAVFERYWYNLMAHARQYHATLNYNNAIEDFAEQAFWKCMQRLMADTDALLAGEYIVYASSNVIVNQANVGGNMYLETLLSVPTEATKQTFTLTTNKPSYLQSVTRMPRTSLPFILGGNEKAWYDNGPTGINPASGAYELTNAFCRKILALTETSETDFTFNAILMYYTIHGIKQLAGIYFPNAFEAVDDYYALPDIQKTSELARGFSIHMKHAIGAQTPYVATNSDIGLAMQAYGKLYESMLKANYQLVTMSETIDRQSLQIANLQSIISGGFFAKIESRLQNLENKVATKLQGTVSANKLLEMFIDAKKAEGTTPINITVTDLSEAITGRDIAVDNELSNRFQIGDIIPAGTSITTLLEDLLSNRVLPTYVHPTLAVLANGMITYYVEAGFTADIPILITATPNDSGGFTGSRVFVTEDGVLRQLVDPGTSFNLAPTVPLYNILTVTVNMTYDEGVTKDDSTGNPCTIGKVYAGNLSVACKIIPTFNIYITTIDIIEQFENVAMIDMLEILSNELLAQFTSNKRYTVVAIPVAAANPIINNVIATTTQTYESVDYMLYCIENHTIYFDLTKLQG